MKKGSTNANNHMAMAQSCMLPESEVYMKIRSDRNARTFLRRPAMINEPPSTSAPINELLAKAISDLAAVAFPVVVVGDFNLPEYAKRSGDWTEFRAFSQKFNEKSKSGTDEADQMDERLTESTDLMTPVLRDEEYQQIAAEFNLSETAFPIPTDGDFHTGNASSAITFATKSGELIVRKAARKMVEMDFPHFELSQISAKRADRMVKLDPDGEFTRGVIVTLAPLHARSQGFVDSEAEPYDYVCRYFAPWVGIMEDPATGSAQCALAPFWGAILKKRSLYAFQSYPNRGAQFRINLQDSGRLSILGQSVTVLQGQLHLNEAIFY
ncbi:phenazine biosynthesis-like protein [Teladorsagia circumcincta]|uniref:Phenazine biosynthesis-like protein n=1 Tax=Teladorsagia circumcincta TaxID=45464 RepID=A0A2G9U7E0_TELCI|nr:phenazine biosynthesis-like protein [Teladorsagia circumcincta]